MEQIFKQTPEEVCARLQVTRDGMTQHEAEHRRKTYGRNTLVEEKRKGMLAVFLDQFKDLLIAILIVSGVISMISGQVESTIVIFAVIFLNAVLGTVQYFKAEKSLESLKSLSAPMSKVMRDGVKAEIKSEELVPGDILILEAGDLVTADARILENYSLKVNESSLTGEAEAVEKTVDVISGDRVALGDRKNMVFSGSLVTYGRALAVVTNIGMDTELGKIAGLMNQTQQRKTPLQVSLDNFSKKLAIIILGVCLVVFGLSLYRQMPVLDALMFAVALAVAAIPEALSSIVTIVLAMGTQKMAREHAVIKDLKAVESLGAVSVVCSDKTGTLTQNKMTVQRMFAGGRTFSKEELDLKSAVQYMLLKAAILVNDATVTDGKEIGDPTETALIQLAAYFGVEEVAYRSQNPRMCELAFDSGRKLMSTVHRIDGDNVMLTKGAMDVLLERCVSVMTEDGVIPMTGEMKARIEHMNRIMSQQGLRVLCFAMKSIGLCNEITFEDENDYTFVGLISMMDPPREESIQAVADAKRGGIKTIMITGDHKITAAAIARKIGIFEEGDLAVEGVELDEMTDVQLDEKLPGISVYARVSPEHKIRIVNAWQRRGCIVSMTGDGVNDAPALKSADIGVAMGITGTEVSKDAASMILTDDNFATIIKAVVNGRNVFRNIKNAISFLLSGNTAGIACVLYTSLAGLSVPFQPVHLLFINLLTDSLPALAIGMEPAKDDLLNRPPRNPRESILNKTSLTMIGLQGLLIGLFTMISFYVGLQTNPAVASTMAFSTLTLARLFHGFNCRGEESIFKLKIGTNLYSVGAFALGVLLLAVVLFVPGLGRLFLVSPLSRAQVGWVTLLALLPTVLIQLYKAVMDRKG